MNVNCDARNMEVELFCNNISFKCSALNQNKCVGKIGKQTQDSWMIVTHPPLPPWATLHSSVKFTGFEKFLQKMVLM